MAYVFIRFPEGKAKAVTFSYDDSTRSDIRLAKTLSDYGMKCTFNVNSDFVDHPPYYLTADEIRENFIDKGHEIALHGARHITLGRITALEGIKEMLNCRLGLEKTFDTIVRGMAYAGSGIRIFETTTDLETIKGYLKDLGIVYARTLGKDNADFLLPSDWLEWMPTAHHDNPNLLEWVDKFVELELQSGYIFRRESRLLYIWGHSSEFDGNGNWDRLEEICKKLSSDNDIWYATNIEIYDYVTAYNSLVWSADGKTVYNPTLKTVWFMADEKLCKISSGETLKI